MRVDRSEVERIARLAHLQFEGADADRLAEEMSRILDYAAHLRGRVDSTPRPEGQSADVTIDVGNEVPEEGLSGARDPGVDGPDSLSVTPDAFAPRFEEDFFVVPPPPGVAVETPRESSEDLRNGTPGED